MDRIEINLETVDSTNEYAKRNYLSFAPHKITCITAEEQTAGHGRWQRKWISPKGGNIYATFYFQLPLQTPQLTTLAHVMAFSLSQVLIEKGLHPKIKWPNDVLLNGKKVSGVLCETVFEKTAVCVFLGIGINVNMPKDILAQIDQPATSLAEETGRLWNQREVLDRLKSQFTKDLALFQQKGFTPFQAQLNEMLAYKGEVVCYRDGKQTWSGICDSLSGDGGLNLLLEIRGEPSQERLYTLTSGDFVMREKTL